MSVNEITRFAAAVKKDAALQEELKKTASDAPAIATFAKSKGFDFTAEELQDHAAMVKTELSEEQLNKVAGGFIVDPKTTVLVYLTSSVFVLI